MPQLPLRITLVDYRRIAEDAKAQGVTPREQIQVVWGLGLEATRRKSLELTPAALRPTHDNAPLSQQSSRGVSGVLDASIAHSTSNG